MQSTSPEIAKQMRDALNRHAKPQPSPRGKNASPGGAEPATTPQPQHGRAPHPPSPQPSGSTERPRGGGDHHPLTPSPGREPRAAGSSSNLAGGIAASRQRVDNSRAALDAAKEQLDQVGLELSNPSPSRSSFIRTLILILTLSLIRWDSSWSKLRWPRSRRRQTPSTLLRASADPTDAQDRAEISQDREEIERGRAEIKQGRAEIGRGRAVGAGRRR